MWLRLAGGPGPRCSSRHTLQGATIASSRCSIWPRGHRLKRGCRCASLPPCRCRYNLVYYGLLLAAGLAGLVLLLATGRLRPANVVGFCIALSNAYGLVAGGAGADGPR